MLRFIVRRILLMIPVLLGVTLVTFIIVHMIPGDPVQVLLGADRRTTPEQIESIRKAYGLDQPLPVQYVKWLGHVVQGDLGNSLRTKRPLTQELGLRLPVSLELTLLSLLFALVPSLVFGVLSAVKRNSGADYAATIVTLIGVSVPNFFLATLLVLLFSFTLKWLPPVGFRPFTDDPVQNLKTMLMPAMALGLPLAAVLMRFTRSSVLEVLGQEYVRTARAKGIPQNKVLTRHVLPNAGIPILTVIIEQIFGLPGVGKYVYDAIANRDYPVVQGVTLVLAFMYVMVSLLVDVLYAVIDPRLRNS
jgi:peptide/nickel transport system permease protein